MSCEKYEAYEAGKLTPEEFAEHAPRCPSCAEQAALDARLDKELTPMKGPVQAPGLWERIEAALVQEKAAAGERNVLPSIGRRPFPVFAGRPRPVVLAACAAALALLILGGAYVTERIMPGVAYQDHGGRVDQIVADPNLPQSEWIDRGGANNLICPEKILSRNCGGQVGSGFLVEVKKVDINELKAKYPEAFARQYDPGSGLRFSGWVVGGEL